MGDVQGRDRRLADVGIDVAGQRAQPGIDRVDGLHHAGEVASLNDLLDQAQPFIRDARILVPDRDRGGDEGLSDQVGAEFLQRGVGVDSLVAGVGVDQRRRLVGHHLLQDCGNGFPLGEPLPPDPGQELRCVCLVEHDRPGRPTIGEGKPIEVVQDPRRGRASGTRQS